jgi:hypothetical protein
MPCTSTGDGRLLHAQGRGHDDEEAQVIIERIKASGFEGDTTVAIEGGTVNIHKEGDKMEVRVEMKGEPGEVREKEVTVTERRKKTTDNDAGTTQAEPDRLQYMTSWLWSVLRSGGAQEKAHRGPCAHGLHLPFHHHVQPLPGHGRGAGDDRGTPAHRPDPAQLEELEHIVKAKHGPLF